MLCSACSTVTVTPWELYRLWRADARRYMPENTAHLYTRTAFRAAADLASHPTEWTATELHRLLSSVSPANAKLMRQALLAWLSWMVDRGHRADNPLADLPPTRRGRRRRIKRAFTEDEYVRLLAEIARPPRSDREDWRRARDRILLMVQAQRYTGLRPNELCTLDVRQVFLSPDPKPRIEVYASKTDDERVVPLSTRAQPIFAALVADRIGRISNIRRQFYSEFVHRAAVRADIPAEKCRPYALRHMFASDLMDAGVPDDRVAQLMGHSDTRMLRDYTARSYRELRAAVETLQ